MKTIILLILISVMVQAQTTYDVGQTNANIALALSQALAQPDSNTVYRNAINTKFSIADSNGVNGWYKRAYLDALIATHTHTDFFDTLSISWGVLDTTYAGSLSGWKVPNDITITEISAYTDANTVTFNLEERAETTPNTAGTDVIGSDLVADTNQEETSTFTNATIAKNSWLVPTISATGDVSIFTISVRYIKTD